RQRRRPPGGPCVGGSRAAGLGARGPRHHARDRPGCRARLAAGAARDGGRGVAARLRRHGHDTRWLVHPREGGPMKLDAVELRRIRLPLVSPFRTSFGTQTERDVLLVRAITPEAEGWGECVAMEEPLYSSEYVDAA